MGKPLTAEVIRHEIARTLTQEERDRVLAKAQGEDTTMLKDEEPPLPPTTEGDEEGGGGGAVAPPPQPATSTEDNEEGGLLDFPDSSSSWLDDHAGGATSRGESSTSTTSGGGREQSIGSGGSLEVLGTTRVVEEGGHAVTTNTVMGVVDEHGEVVSEVVESSTVVEGSDGKVEEIVNTTSTLVEEDGDLVVRTSTRVREDSGVVTQVVETSTVVEAEEEEVAAPAFSTIATSDMIGPNANLTHGGGESSSQVVRAELDNLLGVVLSAVTPNLSPSRPPAPQR